MRRVIVLLVAFAICGCAGGFVTAPLQQRVGENSVAIDPQASGQQFGVGYVSGPDISDDNGFSWSRVFCPVAGSFASCPQYVYGQRSEGPFSVTKTVEEKRPGTASITASGSDALGTAQFSQLLSNDETRGHVGFENFDVVEFNWIDALTPTSSTLPKFAPVQFKVTLTVALSTRDVSCVDANPNTSLTFQATEVDSGGPGLLEVKGACNGTGKHAVFVVTNGSGTRGNVATGTLIGYVGVKQTIYGTGEVETEIPCSTLCFIGNYSAGLAGTAAYTIVPVTSGVSFKTASGATY